jgi:hypothetical protein
MSYNPTISRVRAYNSGSQNLTDQSWVSIAFDSNVYDTGSYHFISAANLTGTVTKEASSTTLVGSGTAFLSELTVGQVIKVPGTANEYRTVSAIASDTSLTVSAAFENNASGQTATRSNAHFAVPETGNYLITSDFRFDSNDTDGDRMISVVVNSSITATTLNPMVKRVKATGEKTDVDIVFHLYLTKHDHITFSGWQNSGATVAIVKEAEYSPYVQISKLN